MSGGDRRDLPSNEAIQKIPGLDLIDMANFQADFHARTPITSPPIQPRSTPLDLTPLPSKPIGEHAGMLNNLCQQHSMRTEYVFYEPHAYTFTATLKLLRGDTELHTFSSATHASKKHAKEEVAAAGLAFLEHQKLLVKAPTTTNATVVAVTPSIDKSQNYVGLLQAHCQSKGQQLPTYTEYILPGTAQFKCTLTIPSHPGKIFGIAEPAYNSKKDAKRMAAKSAVQYLRKEGVMRDLTAQPLATVLPSTSSGSDTENAVAKVLALCSALKVTAPQYQWTQDEGIAGFVSGGAVFDDKKLFPNIVGEVHQIFGQKKAREESAEKVVEVLERMLEERQVFEDF